MDAEEEWEENTAWVVVTAEKEEEKKWEAMMTTKVR